MPLRDLLDERRPHPAEPALAVGEQERSLLLGRLALA
jgi:hypothetical protein